METNRMANRLRGEAIGSLIFTGFGALWVTLGLGIRQQLDAPNIAWIAGVVFTLAAAGTHILRSVKRGPSGPEDAKRNRAFHWINAGQWIAIFIVMNVLKKMHLEVYGVSAMATIVGLHLFPLAKLFKNPWHYATGSLMMAWAACAVWLVSLDTLQSVTALGEGTILWFAAAITLGRILYRLRRRPITDGAMRPEAA